MKKNDILRVRVDAATLAALQRACTDSGCSLSHLLRESIAHELARRSSAPETADCGGPARSIAMAASDERDACAWLLSSILVGRPAARAERWQRKQRRVTRLLESLFRAIEVAPDDAEPRPAYPTLAHSAMLGTETEATRGTHFW
jgi:hypothetical protein